MSKNRKLFRAAALLDEVLQYREFDRASDHVI